MVRELLIDGMQHSYLRRGWALVPLLIAGCPECGDQLLVSHDGWFWGTGELFRVRVQCVGDNWTHRWLRGDWDRVIQVVESWALVHVRLKV